MSAPLYIVRHGETVYNRAARMQGRQPHTPLTRAGMRQAEAMGRRLRAELGARPDIDLWCSTAGRARQTMALICDILECDYFSVRFDDRLVEIDVAGWTERHYHEIEAEIGPFVDQARQLYTRFPEGGEDYQAIARRVDDWLKARDPHRAALVVSHGMTGRVLRGLLIGGDGAPAMPADAPQGTIFRIRDGREERIGPAARDGLAGLKRGDAGVFKPRY
jgi:broad specificity phosphatase PhoE